MKTVKLGIIGLGSIGQLHLKNSLKLANVNLIAVSDLSKKALRLAKNLGVKKTYTNYEKMLADDEIEAVIIALPNHLHLECATKAAEQKKHILLEKPMARSVIEAKKIISIAQKNSIKMMIGYPLRFNPIFRTLKEKIDSGCLGEIALAYATNVSSGPFAERAVDNAPMPVPEWWFNKKLTGGGVLMDLGSHLINLLRWYFGEITNIHGHFGYLFNMDFEDSATCIAKFRSGTTAVICCGWFSQMLQQKVELLGTVTHAKAELSYKSNPLVNVAQKLLTSNQGYESPHLNEVNNFINCIINDFNPSPSPRDGLKDIEAITLAYKNAIHLE